MAIKPKPDDEAADSVDTEARAEEPLAPADANARDIDSKKADAEKADEDAYPDPTHESGGPKGLEPTRYGDWERKGIISDF